MSINIYRIEMRKQALIYRELRQSLDLPRAYSGMNEAVKNAIAWRDFEANYAKIETTKRARHFDVVLPGEAKVIHVTVTTDKITFRKDYERATFSLTILEACRHAERLAKGTIFTQGELDAKA